MSTPVEEWLDAAPLLRRLTAGLAVGELLHGPSFSLFESTTAIEIGDPKMDIGLQRDLQGASAEELIAAGGAPVALSPVLTLAVMDRLLCLEATWHAGSMLPQTVFTSLHMLQPDRLAANAPLHAFCLALRSACTVFVDMAHAGSVTEDEDFSVHTFGIRMLDLPGPQPVAAALRALAAAEEQLEQWAAGEGSPGGSRRRRPEGAGEEAPPPTPAQAAALLARVRLRRLLLEALQALQQFSQAGVEAGRRHCRLALDQLQLVAGSAGEAAPLGEAPGFVPDVNRRHMGLVPPRPVHLVAFEQAVEHWQGLLGSLDTTLHTLLSVRGSWASLKAALVALAARNMHAVVRSALHLQLIKPLPAAGAPAQQPQPQQQQPQKVQSPARNDGKAGGRKPAAEVPPWCPGQAMAAREFGLSLGALPGVDAALFVEQAAIAMQGQAYALCLNRCRQRRRLRRQLEDWKNIFDHGFNADVAPEMQAGLARVGWRWAGQYEGLLHQQGPAATWAEREAAGCALLHLQLGFPLDLYAVHEYLPLYWYCDYLLEVQYRNGRLLHAAAPAAPASPPPKRAAGGRGARGRGAAAPPAGGEQPAAREVELVLLEVERLMCGGMLRAALALRLLGLAPPPAAPFNDEEQRYEQRFGFLAQLLRPEPLPYASFAACADPGAAPPARALATALQSFQRAAERAGGLLGTPPLRALLRSEQAAHLEGLRRVAAQNAIAMRLLAATSASGGGDAAGGGGTRQRPALKATFDFKPALASGPAAFYPTILLKS